MLQSAIGWESSRLATEIANNAESGLAALAKSAELAADEREKLQQLLRYGPSPPMVTLVYCVGCVACSHLGAAAHCRPRVLRFGPLPAHSPCSKCRLSPSMMALITSQAADGQAPGRDHRDGDRAHGRTWHGHPG